MKEHWHISKSVSVGHIISTFLVAVSVVGYAGNLDHKIDVNSLKIANVNVMVDERFNRMDERFNRIDQRLKTITGLLIKRKR